MRSASSGKEHLRGYLAYEGEDIVGWCNANEKFIDEDRDFRGPRAMFERCGFEKCGEREGRIVMRRALTAMRCTEASND